jgi:hypothetical protein
MFQQSTFIATASALSTYSSLGPDALVTNLHPVSTAMTNANNQINSLPSLSTLSSQLTSAKSQLDAVPISTAVSQVSQLQTDLDPSTLNLNAISSAVDSVVSGIGSVDLSTVRADIVSFNSSIANAKANALSNVRLVCFMRWPFR